MNIARLWRNALLLALLVLLASCSGISNLRPTHNSTVPAGSVTLSGEFRSNVNNSLRIEVDGVDRTATFNPVYNTAPGTFSATLPLGTGLHRMEVSGIFTQYFLIFPIGQRAMSSFVDFTVLGPTLNFSPASVSTTVGATTNLTVNLSSSQSAAVPVTLSSAPANVVSHNGSVTIAAGSTSAPITLTGLAAGDTTLTASAPGIANVNVAVSVIPGLAMLAPTQGPVGTNVTLTGTGFVAGATTVRFGNTNSPSVTVNSATSLTATVPTGLGSGTINVSVTVANKTSVSRPFNVLAAPVVPVAVLFRTSAQDVQTFTFTPAAGGTPASFALVDTDSATAQGGLYTVGLMRSGSILLRTSPVDAQTFTISSGPSLTLSATRSGSPSGTGSAAALNGTTAVRATDSGIQVSVIGGGGTSLSPFVTIGGTPSATGVAVDILGTMVVRAHSSGIDLFSVSNPTVPTRLSNPGSGAGDLSSVGTGVRFISSTLVVRTFPQGIEIYDVSNPSIPTRTTVNRTGTVDSAMGTAVAVEPGGGAVIRATSTNLERYLLPLVANAPPAKSTNSRVSTTGVGVVVVGTRAFRATNDRIEAYDLPALGSPIANLTATVSSVGVGLAGQ